MTVPIFRFWVKPGIGFVTFCRTGTEKIGDVTGEILVDPDATNRTIATITFKGDRFAMLPDQVLAYAEAKDRGLTFLAVEKTP